MLVLLEPAVTHLGEAEDALDDPDGMLDFRPHFGFGAVLGALDRIDDAALSIPAVGEIPRPRRFPADHGAGRDRLGRPRRGFPCHAAARAGPGCQRYWPASPPPHGSAWCGCRCRDAPSCRNTTGCPSSSDASRDRAPWTHSWSRTPH